MTGSSTDRPVLVAVADPDHVEQLTRTAGDLARAAGSHVEIVSIVAKPHSSPFSLYTDETIVEQFAADTTEVLELATAVAPDDLRVEREILVDRTVADGVATAIERSNAGALVIGWQDRRRRTDAVLGTNLDRLVEHAPCDLYVERIGAEANGVDSILVPVAGGPHVRPAVTVAKAIAVHNDATVHVLSVADSNDEALARESIAAALGRLEEAPGPDVATASSLEGGEDVPDVLVEAAADHDVLVLGVTRQSPLHRRLVGSVAQTVLARTEATVLLARAGEVVERSWFDRLRRRWGRP